MLGTQQNNPDNKESKYCECGARLISETERIEGICEGCK